MSYVFDPPLWVAGIAYLNAAFWIFVLWKMANHDRIAEAE